MEAYYPQDYAPYNMLEDPAGVVRGGWRAVLSRWFGSNARQLPAVHAGRLLEIGCAAGAYMEKLHASGWQVEGIEFSEAAAAQARARGFTVQTATVETASAPTEPCDVVAAWMVLEHLHEPVVALKKVLAWVKPDGYLLASIPDAGSMERRVFGSRWYALQLPTHLFHYTPTTIRRVLAAAGWTVEKITWTRNCNNLLWSLEYLAEDKQANRLKEWIQWFRTSAGAARMRSLLALLLGATRQSGRMEVWARPTPANNVVRGLHE